MAIAVEYFQIFEAPMRHASGDGYLAGEAPANPSDPASPDGRFRRLNVPAMGRVLVFERGTALCVASVISNANGTWRVEHLSMEMPFTVIGYDDLGQLNAAVQDWVLPVAMT